MYTLISINLDTEAVTVTSSTTLMFMPNEWIDFDASWRRSSMIDFGQGGFPLEKSSSCFGESEVGLEQF